MPNAACANLIVEVEIEPESDFDDDEFDEVQGDSYILAPKL